MLSGEFQNFLFVEGLKAAGMNVLNEVVVSAARISSTTSFEVALSYWNAFGKVPYGGARNIIYSTDAKGKYILNEKGEKQIKYAWFNFTDKQADCVECIMAPMQNTQLFDDMSYKNGSHGRNAQVQHMIDGLKKNGYTFRKTNPKRGDLMFWTTDGTAEGAGTHVARVFKVHGENFATWGASVSSGTPHVSGLNQLGDPYFTINDINGYRIGSGKFAGFVTLKP